MGWGSMSGKAQRGGKIARFPFGALLVETVLDVGYRRIFCALAANT